MGATTFSIITLSITIRKHDIQHNDILCLCRVSLCWESFVVSVTNNTIMLNVIMLSVVMLNIVAPQNVFHFPGFSCTRLSAQSASRTHRQRRSGHKFTKIFWNFTSKLSKDFTKRYLCSRAGSPYRRGRISTVDLLVLIGSEQVLLIQKNIIFPFYNTSYLNGVVNCTEPSISVSVPCHGMTMGGHGVFAELGCTTVVTLGIIFICCGLVKKSSDFYKNN